MLQNYQCEIVTKKLNLDFLTRNKNAFVSLNRKSAYATRENAEDEELMSRVVDPRVMATVRLTFDTRENDNL